MLYDIILVKMLSFVLFFLLLGNISIVSQVVIVRELMAAFFGNELFVGIVLGIWLLGTGLGSFLILKLFPKLKTKKVCFLLEIFLFLLLPLIIFLIRFFVGKTLLPGEVPSFSQSLLFIFLTLFPFCFLLGGLFSLGAKVWTKKDLAFVVSRAYFFETIGFAIGGLLFNFFLVSSAFPFPKNLNYQTLSFRYPNLVETVNSRYGSIVVTKTGDQFNFYENGSLLGPSEDREGNEYFIHTIFAFHPNPQNVLFIGGGLNGSLFEILKYKSVEKIDYVELDPKLVEIQKIYLPPDLAPVLGNPRVKTHFLDARRFLKQAKEEYDLIIFSLPNPSTALLNRFYTKEAFQEVKRLLTDDGVLAFTLDVPVDYLSEEAKSLSSSVYKTVKSVFTKISLLPEETSVLFLASSSSFTPNFDIKINTQYFSSEYLRYRLTSPKIDQVKNLLEKEKTRINTDFYPTAYFYQTAFWQTTQSFQLAKIFKASEKISWLLFAFLGVSILLFLKTKIDSSILAMGIASFTLMTIEILIIFLFQSQLGYLYSKIALVFTTILVSMGIGNVIGTKLASHSSCHPELDSGSIQSMKIPKPVSPGASQGGRVRNDICGRALLLIKLSIILYLLLFIPIIKNYSCEPVFYLLGGIIGLLVGAVFPLANKIYFEKLNCYSSSEGARATESRRFVLSLSKGSRQARTIASSGAEKVGVLYSADLFGALFGAILPSIFFIPIFGIEKTIFLLLAFNLFSLK